MSKVMVDGEQKRPEWRYENVYKRDELQMLESIRNAVEQVAERLMEQSNIVNAIRVTSDARVSAIIREIKGLRRDIKSRGRKR